MKKIFILAAFVLCAGAVVAQTEIKPQNPAVFTEGRTIEKNGIVSFCYPGTKFSLKFSGTSVSVKLKANAGYYTYSVDGGEHKKFSTYTDNSGQKVYTHTLAENLAEGEHTVSVMLVSEGLFCFPEFYGFELNSGAKLLKYDTKKRIKIEFIGNSITCGYGNEASGRDDKFADSTSNFAKSFAGVTIKNLNAVSMVVARSGIGIYKNYGDVKSGSQWPMPKVYENTLINDTLTKWDFSKWKPDVVVLGLGTNDLSEDNYNYEKFALAYITFLKNIRAHYPNAKIVLLNSPMLHYQQSQDLMNVISNSKNAMAVLQDTKIYRFDFQELSDNPSDYGADWHPSAKKASEMARYLSYFIETEVVKKKKK
jgi:lysophospholipase L1-like esterase